MQKAVFLALAISATLAQAQDARDIQRQASAPALAMAASIGNATPGKLRLGAGAAATGAGNNAAAFSAVTKFDNGLQVSSSLILNSGRAIAWPGLATAGNSRPAFAVGVGYEF